MRGFVVQSTSFGGVYLREHTGMGQAMWRIKVRKEAKKRLSDIMNAADRVVVIHYSCESFYHRPDGSSPRITSIAVLNLASRQTRSFSIHQLAERHHYSARELEQHYDELERQMLDDFYEYVHTRAQHYWLHWNMRNINYGFQAIAHRYRVLGGEPIDIHESQLVDLSGLLIALYGVRYIRHPRLPSLIAVNRITDRDFLTGEEEAQAFDCQEYVQLHLSTLRKVDILASIAARAHDGSLKTHMTCTDRYGTYPQAVGEWVQEHWIAALITFVIAIISVIVSIASLF